MSNESAYQIDLDLDILGEKKAFEFSCSNSSNGNRDLQKLIPEFWSVNVCYGNPHRLLDKTDWVFIQVPQLTSSLMLEKIGGLHVL